MACASVQVLGADGLLYQSIDDLLAVAQSLNPGIQQFEASCFTGKFPAAAPHANLVSCDVMLRTAHGRF